MVSQISGVMTTGNTGRQLSTLTPQDVLVVPSDAVATGDFDKAREALAIGGQVSEAARGRQPRLSLPAGRDAASLEVRRRRENNHKEKPPRILRGRSRREKGRPGRPAFLLNLDYQPRA